MSELQIIPPEGLPESERELEEKILEIVRLLGNTEWVDQSKARLEELGRWIAEGIYCFANLCAIAGEEKHILIIEFDLLYKAISKSVTQLKHEECKFFVDLLTNHCKEAMENMMKTAEPKALCPAFLTGLITNLSEIFRVVLSCYSPGAQLVSSFQIEGDKIYFCSISSRDFAIIIIISSNDMQMMLNDEAISKDQIGFERVESLIQKYSKILLGAKNINLVKNDPIVQLLLMLLLYCIKVHYGIGAECIKRCLQDLETVLLNLDWLRVRYILDQVMEKVREFAKKGLPEEIFEYFKQLQMTLTELNQFIIFNAEQNIAFGDNNGVGSKYSVDCCDNGQEVVRSLTMLLVKDQTIEFSCKNTFYQHILKERENEVTLLTDDLFNAVYHNDFEDILRFSQLLLLWFLLCLYGFASKELKIDQIRNYLERFIKFFNDKFELKSTAYYSTITEMVILIRKLVEENLSQEDCNLSTLFMAYDCLVLSFPKNQETGNELNDYRPTIKLPLDRYLGLYTVKTEGTEKFICHFRQHEQTRIHHTELKVEGNHLSCQKQKMSELIKFVDGLVEKLKVESSFNLSLEDFQTLIFVICLFCFCKDPSQQLKSGNILSQCIAFIATKYSEDDSKLLEIFYNSLTTELASGALIFGQMVKHLNNYGLNGWDPKQETSQTKNSNDHEKDEKSAENESAVGIAEKTDDSQHIEHHDSRSEERAKKKEEEEELQAMCRDKGDACPLLSISECSIKICDMVDKDKWKVLLKKIHNQLRRRDEIQAKMDYGSIHVVVYREGSTFGDHLDSTDKLFLTLAESLRELENSNLSILAFKSFLKFFLFLWALASYKTHHHSHDNLKDERENYLENLIKRLKELIQSEECKKFGFNVEQLLSHVNSFTQEIENFKNIAESYKKLDEQIWTLESAKKIHIKYSEKYFLYTCDQVKLEQKQDIQELVDKIQENITNDPPKVNSEFWDVFQFLFILAIYAESSGKIKVVTALLSYILQNCNDLKLSPTENEEFINVFVFLVKFESKTIDSRLISLKAVLDEFVKEIHRYKEVISHTHCFFLSYNETSFVVKVCIDEICGVLMGVNEAADILDEKMGEITSDDDLNMVELTVFSRIVVIWLMSLAQRQEQVYGRNYINKIEDEINKLIVSKDEANNPSLKKELEDLKEQLLSVSNKVFENPFQDLRALLATIKNVRMRSNEDPLLTLDLMEIEKHRSHEVPDDSQEFLPGTDLVFINSQTDIAQFCVVVSRSATDTFFVSLPPDYPPSPETIHTFKAKKEDISKMIEDVKTQLAFENSNEIINFLLLLWLILRRVQIFEEVDKALPSEERFIVLTNEMKTIPNVIRSISIEDAVVLMKPLWETYPNAKLKFQLNQCFLSMCDKKSDKIRFSCYCIKTVIFFGKWERTFIFQINHISYSLSCKVSEVEGNATKNKIVLPWLNACEELLMLIMKIFRTYHSKRKRVRALLRCMILVLMWLWAFKWSKNSENVDPIVVHKVEAIISSKEGRILSEKEKELLLAILTSLENKIKSGWDTPFKEVTDVIYPKMKGIAGMMRSGKTTESQNKTI